MKRISNWLSNFILRGLIGLLLSLPYTVRVRTMGWVAEQIVSPLAGYRKRIRANLAHVMPSLPEAEVKRLCKMVPNNVGRTFIEIYSGKEFVSRAIRAPISGPGLNALEKARAEGRPVILVTGHIGNYDVSRAALIARGYNLGALYRRMSNPYFNTHYLRAISTIGTPLFEQGRKGILQMVRHIASGGMLGVLPDVYAPRGTPLVYFGKPAVTSFVTAELALKYNAALIPIYAIRQENGFDFEIIIKAEIPHSDAQTMTQAMNDVLEETVRDNMHQWFWIHRRWKQPEREQ